ncbi:MAG: hypothetical protein ACYDB4_19210 [Candidatus Dormibacteraceae bacterium]
MVILTFNRRAWIIAAAVALSGAWHVLLSHLMVPYVTDPPTSAAGQTNTPAGRAFGAATTSSWPQW